MKYTIISACRLKFIMSCLLLAGLSGVVNAANIASVPKIGPGDTATVGTGKQWPTTRFVLDPSGNCITDNLTGLMWAKNGNLFGLATWATAKSKVAQMNTTSGATGYNLCGYTDWRLPTINELTSLVNYASSKPNEWLMYGSGSAATPACAGACFSNVQTADDYWSSTTDKSNPGNAWGVNMSAGQVGSVDRGLNNSYVWPVRGGK